MAKPRMQKRTKQIIISSLFIFAGILTILLMLFILINKKEGSREDQPSLRNDQPQSVKQEKDSNLTMLATGDWIAHDAINAESKTGSGYDYSSISTPFAEVFADSDINFCNLATMAGGEDFGISGYPVFNAPLEWNRDMIGLGCNVINTGTNHTNDKGQAVIDANLNHLDNLSDILAVAGANRSDSEQQSVRYFEQKGVKFAFLSYSTYSNSPNPNSYSLNRFEDDLVLSQMTEASQQADIVIVSMRWGTEYSDEINAGQKQAASRLAELGADIVLGHGTHTLQPVETLAQPNGDSTIVWYGLGNFINAQLEVGGLTGCVAKITIDVNTKKVSDNQCLPFYMHYDWPEEGRQKGDLMSRHNFKIMPLFSADEYLGRSQFATSSTTQYARIRAQINRLMSVGIIESQSGN